jgi:hypothetical protein
MGGSYYCYYYYYYYYEVQRTKYYFIFSSYLFLEAIRKIEKREQRKALISGKGRVQCGCRAHIKQFESSARLWDNYKNVKK